MYKSLNIRKIYRKRKSDVIDQILALVFWRNFPLPVYKPVVRPVYRPVLVWVVSIRISFESFGEGFKKARPCFSFFPVPLTGSFLQFQLGLGEAWPSEGEIENHLRASF